MTYRETMTDKDLVDAIKKDSAAFTVLVERYERPIGSLIRRYLYAYPENVVDVQQETFLRAYRFINSYNDTMELSSWLYAIAKNESYRFLQKHRNDPVPEGQVLRHDEQDYSLFELVSDPSTQYDPQVHDVRVMLEELSLKYRDVLILRYYQGLSYGEIADVLQVSTGSVSTLIHRATKALRAVADKHSYN